MNIIGVNDLQKGLTMITSVNEFCIHQHLTFEGQRCKIIKFPTRSTVVLEAIGVVEQNQWTTQKTTIKKLRKGASETP